MHRILRTTVAPIFLGLALCGLLAACGGGSGGTASGGTNFKIYVTDAPFPGDLVESATVVIREVRVRAAGGGGWQTVFDGSAEQISCPNDVIACGPCPPITNPT